MTNLLPPAPRAILLCFSHLRWDFVFQRPHHLMTRFAQIHDVYYWEEPVFRNGLDHPFLAERQEPSGVTILTPHLPSHGDAEQQDNILRGLLEAKLSMLQGPLVRWYYTPMMLGFSSHLAASFTVYDCMDELSGFRFAPANIVEKERELLALADIVFTGGLSLYEAKAKLHPNVHAFPSSVDQQHFRRARSIDAPDGARPRIGFFGVIDERFDIDLLAEVARHMPYVEFEIVGPVAKIDPADLPQATNISYRGARTYDQLPEEIARWQCAIMPFALNEATRFISPTKTPEYLAAGRPVVSTPVPDVERSFGQNPGVLIAEDVEGFVAACQCALALFEDPSSWRDDVDAGLALQSWDRTFFEMNQYIEKALVAFSSRVRLLARRADYDFLVVGAGFAGSVMAERLASEAGKKVLLIDKRHHFGGNAYDERDFTGALVHRYGPHIFHTNAAEIFAYLSRFTRWRRYEHRVKAQVDGKLLPFPINRETLNALYGKELANGDEVQAYLDSVAVPIDDVQTAEDRVLSSVGRELYELFFRGYTRKQWGVEPHALDKSVTARIPVRFDDEDRYFTDSFQYMPLDGYTAMFSKMLDHPNIDIALGMDFEAAASQFSFDRLVWTGAVDDYFGNCFGKLPYRSLRFEHKIEGQSPFQPVGTVNYPDENIPYTRITEFSHLTGIETGKASIVYEYPTADGDPYYPVPCAEAQALYNRYKALARQCDTVFVGRLATYQYYNMDQVVGQALSAFKRLVIEPGERRRKTGTLRVQISQQQNAVGSNFPTGA